MNAIVFALISYFGWGVGDVFGAVASRKIGGYQTAWWVMIAASILFTPLMFIYWHYLAAASVWVIISAILVGFFFLSGNFAINEALQRTNPSIALTINGSFAALVVIFSLIFLHEPISVFQAGVIVLIFVGVFLCTYQPGSSIKRKDMRGIWYAIYSMTSFGIFFTAVKVFAPTLSWFWPIYLSFLWIPVMYMYMRRIKIYPSFRDMKRALFPLAGSMLFLRGGDFAFNIGLQQGLAATVAPIGGAYPTLSVLLAYLVFREKITRRQTVGILCALLGIVALSTGAV